MFLKSDEFSVITKKKNAYIRFYKCNSVNIGKKEKKACS